MKYLLDTHILIWAVYEDEKLSSDEHALISDKRNEIYYSILSIFEIELKRTTHPEKMPIISEKLLEFADKLGFIQMPLKIPHIMEIKNLKRPENVLPHKDPFDRLMLCQAISENMIFMTHDKRIAEYDTPNIYKVS